MLQLLKLEEKSSMRNLEEVEQNNNKWKLSHFWKSFLR